MSLFRRFKGLGGSSREDEWSDSESVETPSTATTASNFTPATLTCATPAQSLEHMPIVQTVPILLIQVLYSPLTLSPLTPALVHSPTPAFSDPIIPTHSTPLNPLIMVQLDQAPYSCPSHTDSAPVRPADYNPLTSTGSPPLSLSHSAPLTANATHLSVSNTPTSVQEDEEDSPFTNTDARVEEALI